MSNHAHRSIAIALATLLAAFGWLFLIPAVQAQPIASTNTGTQNKAQSIDRLAVALQQTETTLQRPDLTDPALQGIRDQLEPLTADNQEVIEGLTLRLAEIKTRLDQLGPKPDAKSPPEGAAVAAERADEEKTYSQTDQMLKRARLLAVQADQTQAQILARRRELFTHSLFERTVSIASPSLWAAVVRETPGNVLAAGNLIEDWLTGIGTKLNNWRMPAFWSLLALIFFLIWPLSRFGQHILSRESTIAEPSRLQKILAAWWVALVVATLPVTTLLALGAVFEFFHLSDPTLQPLVHAIGGGVIRVALAAAIATGLFAPSRPNWRLLRLDDATSDRLVRLALIVTTVLSILRVIEALNEINSVSLNFTVATRGVGALVIVAVIGSALRGMTNEPDAGNECLGPRIAPDRDLFRLWRLLTWAAIIVIAGSVLAGYVALGSFLVEQLVWTSGIACLLFMTSVLLDESMEAGLQPTTPFGRVLINNVGFHRESLAQLAVLLSGASHLVLLINAALLVLAPWGIQSTDVPAYLRAAFFGFKLGEITISLSSLVMAVLIFGTGFAITRAIQHWLETRFLPLTRLDPGLRNAIKTSLGYIGFLVAIGLAFGYLGLSFERLAIVAGALSVGIGFGLQSIVNNFVSGLILLWERAVRVGDWIVVGTDEGFVRRINVRSTEIETFDRAAVIIPNSNLVSGIVKNFVRTDRIGRIKIGIGADPAADPEKVRAYLSEIAKSHDQVLDTPAPFVMFVGITPTALNFELLCFVGDVEIMARVKSELNFQIFKRLKADGLLAAPTPPAIVNVMGLEKLEGFLKPDGPSADLIAAKTASGGGEG